MTPDQWLLRRFERTIEPDGNYVRPIFQLLDDSDELIDLWVDSGDNSPSPVAASWPQPFLMAELDLSIPTLDFEWAS